MVSVFLVPVCRLSFVQTRLNEGKIPNGECMPCVFGCQFLFQRLPFVVSLSRFTVCERLQLTLARRHRAETCRIPAQIVHDQVCSRMHRCTL